MRTSPRDLARDAEDAGRGAARRLISFASVRAFGRLEAHEQAVAHAGRAGGGLVLAGRQADRLRVAVALHQPDEELAVRVPLDHVDDPDGGQGSGGGDVARDLGCAYFAARCGV